jgi:hypothetical protein
MCGHLWLLEAVTNLILLERFGQADNLSPAFFALLEVFLVLGFQTQKYHWVSKSLLVLREATAHLILKLSSGFWHCK